MDTGGHHPDPLVLEQFGVFASLDLQQRRRMAALLAEDEVEPGATLSVQGDKQSRFFVIVEGEADIVQNGEVVGRLRRGDHFGEIAILSEGPRTASIVAATPMKVLVMFGTAFRAMEQEFPAVAKAIYADAARRLDDDDER